MELRYNVNDDIIEGIRQRTDITNASDIGRQSLAFFDWAIQQAEAGKTLIRAVDSSGGSAEWPISNVINSSRW